MTEELPRYGWQRRALAARSTTPAATLVRLFAESPKDSLKRAIARNVNTPPEVLAHLAWAWDQQIRAGVATNTNSPTAVIAALTKDESKIVRDAAFRNPAISTHLSGPVAPGLSARWPQTVEGAISVLLDDGGAELAKRVGGHASDCPPEVLATLAHSRLVVLRERVASDRNADAQTLDFLARSAGGDVQSAVARNENTSASTLDYLGNLIVARGQYGFNVGVFLMAERVADRPNTGAGTLATLAKHGTRQVRQHVARNPRTPPGVLSALAYDDSMAVIEKVAGNPNSPSSALTALAGMALGVKKDFRGTLLSNRHGVNAVITDLDRVLGSGSTWGSVLAQVAENPSTPIGTLAQLIEEGYGEYVARNPSAPAPGSASDG